MNYLFWRFTQRNRKPGRNQSLWGEVLRSLRDPGSRVNKNRSLGGRALKNSIMVLHSQSWVRNTAQHSNGNVFLGFQTAIADFSRFYKLLSTPVNQGFQERMKWWWSETCVRYYGKTCSGLINVFSFHKKWLIWESVCDVNQNSSKRPSATRVWCNVCDGR